MSDIVENFKEALDHELQKLNIAPSVIIERHPKTKYYLARFQFYGRDASGHAEKKDMNFEIDYDPEKKYDELITQKLKTQIKNSLRVNNHPPVLVCPEMTIDHIKVSRPLAKRLELDHESRDERRKIVAKGVYRYVKRQRLPDPEGIHDYRITVDRNECTHREQLGKNIWWKGKQLIIQGNIYPDQMLIGMIGHPITRLIEHPILDEETIIRKCESIKKTAPGNNGGVTIIETDVPWVNGSDL